MVASYTDGHGFAETSTSAPTAAVPTSTTRRLATVTISGTATEDQVLTANLAGAMPTGSARISYQWQRNGVDICGATGATYMLGDADVGATITVVVSYTDGHGFAESSTSAPTAAVAAVERPRTGRCDGHRDGDGGPGAHGGHLGTWPDADGLGAFSYQWQRNGVDIFGATDRPIRWATPTSAPPSRWR